MLETNKIIHPKQNINLSFKDTYDDIKREKRQKNMTVINSKKLFAFIYIGLILNLSLILAKPFQIYDNESIDPLKINENDNTNKELERNRRFIFKNIFIPYLFSFMTGKVEEVIENDEKLNDAYNKGKNFMFEGFKT